jgi:purine-nucleoside phosphorylase
VSKRSWDFDPGDSANHLIKKVRQDSCVDAFDLAIVLGSGWGNVAHLGERLASFNYSDWSCFPSGQIKGHSGRLDVIRLAPWNILVFSGRFHCYQGLTAFQASFPVRLANALGCPRILLSCATGGINSKFRPGDFMLVEDHINLLGDNPLKGLSEDPFVDMVDAYNHEVYDACNVEETKGLTLHRGVLASMLGPSYETPAEINFLRTIGADVVSMSTVHETIMARYLGMEVAAVAFISNLAAGISQDAVSHADVLECGRLHAEDFPALVSLLISSWQKLPVRS